jgi:hypothetical protein
MRTEIVGGEEYVVVRLWEDDWLKDMLVVERPRLCVAVTGDPWSAQAFQGHAKEYQRVTMEVRYDEAV